MSRSTLKNKTGTSEKGSAAAIITLRTRPGRVSAQRHLGCSPMPPEPSLTDADLAPGSPASTRLIIPEIKDCAENLPAELRATENGSFLRQESATLTAVHPFTFTLSLESLSLSL